MKTPSFASDTITRKRPGFAQIVEVLDWFDEPDENLWVALPDPPQSLVKDSATVAVKAFRHRLWQRGINQSVFVTATEVDDVLVATVHVRVHNDHDLSRCSPAVLECADEAALLKSLGLQGEFLRGRADLGTRTVFWLIARTPDASANEEQT